jgi:hypothetical protein
MAFWMVGLVALVVVVAMVMRLLKDDSLARERVDERLHDPGTPTLEYAVPTGEDPVFVVAALERAGYTVGVDSHGPHQVVMVECPDGPDRSRTSVRAVIGSAGDGGPRDGVPVRAAVRFRDEG